LSGNTPEMSRVEYAAIAALASAFALMPREVGRLLDDSRVTAEGRAAR